MLSAKKSEKYSSVFKCMLKRLKIQPAAGNLVGVKLLLFKECFWFSFMFVKFWNVNMWLTVVG